jgi:hypothetical protein
MRALSVVATAARKKTVATAMACRRCLADPKPPNFGSRRMCAFDDDGNFTERNWNCATITALTEAAHEPIYGCDETMEIVPARKDHDHGGWLIFTRYKQRGKVSSLIQVGDFWPPRHVTLEMAERYLDEGILHRDGRD